MKHLYIFSDNDEAGREAAANACDTYNNIYDVTIWRPPKHKNPKHKDWNDTLKEIWEARQ